MSQKLFTITGLFAVFIFLSVATCAADLTGQVHLPDGRPAKDAVVYLEGGAASKPLNNAMVDQRRKAFIPHVSVVTRGTRVRFPNNDSVFHNVFAYYQAKKFDLGMYPRGASKTVTFDKAGLVDLLCNVHSEMSAYIMVVDTPYYAVTDSLGKFQIAHIPSGGYILHSWHETGAQATQAFSAGSGQAALTLHLHR